ncbi:class I SAM-dependent methyltransferase [Bacteriovoracaceae bacterium]|nr:class I SAM-dependent methyltransferase [Bacteriovoracaceae bacterium]
MSQEIYNTYVDNAFGGQRKMANFKISEFYYNYLKYFPKNKETPILDIGVGRGEMLKVMKDNKYAHYKGIDISPSTVTFCQDQKLNCELIEDTQKWLTEHRNSFGVITLLDVLEHIPRDQSINFLKSIKKSLLQDGKVIIQVPNLQSPDGQLHRYNDFTHESGFVEHSLEQILLVAGFKNISFSGFETFVEPNVKNLTKRCLRYLYWKYVRFIRRISGNLSPEILHPVFYVVAQP